MHPDDQEKIAFVMELGVFVAIVIMLGLKTAPTIFQRIIMEIFREYIPTFIQVFLDDFDVYSLREDHLDHLRMCLEKCRTARLSLNPVKCAFEVTSGALLRHIGNRVGIVVDPDKVRETYKPRHRPMQKHLVKF